MKKKASHPMKTLYIGVDIAKKSFDVAYCKVRKAEWLGKYPNDESGYEALKEQVERIREELGAETVHLILEPTGGYELGLALFAYANGWEVTKPNPLTLRRWAEGVGYRVKTDPIDARVCAEYGYLMEPKGHALVPLFVRELDYLLRRRDDLEQLLQMERNRLQNGQAMPDMPQAVLADIEQTITAIGQQRDALVKTIKAHLKRHPQLQTLYRQLLGVPGIGLKSVLPLLVILYRFDSLSAGEGGKKQLTAFLGLDSQIRQSGTSVSGVPRISKRGDKQTRARLYMCALGGIRGHNVLRDFYRLMVARGKAKKVALVACSRKILHWAWAIFKSGQDFDPALATTTIGAAQP